MLLKLLGLLNTDLKLITSFILLLFVFNSFSQTSSTLWIVDNLTEIGGHTTQILGNPKIINTDIGTAVEFDGIDDGIIVNNNPMAGVTAFTIEVIFKPYSDGGVEQRFLHFQQDDNNRILIELRNNSNTNWSLDTFIKSGASNKTLLDYAFTHNLNTWHHAALTYKNGIMSHYVNGNKELEGNVTYQTVTNGQTSLGMRLNQVSWYKGAIRAVKITNDVISPDDFISTETSLGITGVKNEKGFMWQITPNPLVYASTLKYTLPEATKVSVKLVTMLGEEVAVLCNGFKNQGNHEINISRNQLMSGLYFLLITYGNTKHVKKLIIAD